MCLEILGDSASSSTLVLPRPVANVIPQYHSQTNSTINYSLCSLLYCSQQLLTVQPAIFLTAITPCTACYIPHNNYSLCSLLYSSHQLLTVQPAIFLTTITHFAACYFPHNIYSLCSLLFSSQQLLTVQPAIYLTTITHCAARYIAHSNFSALYVFHQNVGTFLFRQCYKKNQERAFRSLREVTAFNICFSGGRLWQHRSA